MNRLLVLSGIVALGIGTWHYWPQEPPPAPVQGPPPPAKVDFPVKMRVKRLIEEWKRRETLSGDRAGYVPLVKVQDEMTWIKRHMFSKGIHDAKSLRNVILQATKELGYSDEQSEIIVQGIHSMSR